MLVWWVAEGGVASHQLGCCEKRNMRKMMLAIGALLHLVVRAIQEPTTLARPAFLLEGFGTVYPFQDLSTGIRSVGR